MAADEFGAGAAVGIVGVVALGGIGVAGVANSSCSDEVWLFETLAGCETAGEVWFGMTAVSGRLLGCVLVLGGMSFLWYLSMICSTGGG